MPRIVRILVIVISLTVFFTFPAYSVTEAPIIAHPITSFSLTPSIGGILFSSTDALHPTPLYGLRFSYDHIGKDVTDTIGVEGTVNYFSTTTKSGGAKAQGALAGVNAIFSFMPRNKWVPFFTIGGGEILLEKESKSSSNPFVDYSVGVKYYLENYLAIRVEARQAFIYQNIDTRNNFTLTTGLTYYFGKERIKKLPPPVLKKPQLNLPKAIPDLIDIDELTPVAPDLMMLEKIGAAGAGIPAITAPPVQFEPTPPPEPLRAPALAFKQLMRSTGLSETPQPEAPKAGIAVAPLPAAPASGKVGTPSASRPAQPAARATRGVAPSPAAAKPAAPAKQAAAASRPAQPAVQTPSRAVAPGALPATAPATLPATAPVAEQAKPAQLSAGKMAKFLMVWFDSGKSRVNPKYEKGLAAMAAMINASPESTVRIEGHTDSTGSLNLNLALSQQRAESVKAQLIKFGVAPQRVVIKSFGSSKPQTSNKTPEGRQMNRRAVITDTTVIIVQ